MPTVRVTSPLKSPLRYPGGKARAVKVIGPMVPENTTTIVSPFMGGGSLELYWAQSGKKVIAYDAFKPLVGFWSHILGQIPHGLRTFLTGLENYTQHYPVTKEGFYEIQKHFRETLEQHPSDGFGLCCAVEFFILNRSSFSGTTLSGGCSDPSARFTPSSIERVRKFADFSGDLTVDYNLWQDTLSKHPQEFMYIDPPYWISSKLYGNRGDMHEGFSHLDLALALTQRKAPWLLSYNDCELVRELYKDFNIQDACWRYGMGSNKKGKELLISNY